MSTAVSPHAPVGGKSRATVRAGRILMFLAVLHLTSTAILSRGHMSDWLAGELWMPDFALSELNATAGAFWLSVGSFGLPLLLLGGTVAWLGNAGRTAPAFVGWGLGVWGLVGAALLEPTPFITVLIPAVMIVSAASRNRQRGRGVGGGG